MQADVRARFVRDSGLPLWPGEDARVTQWGAGSGLAFRAPYDLRTETYAVPT